MMTDPFEIKLPGLLDLDDLIDQDFWTFGEVDEDLIERCRTEEGL
jgi:hypothetical protein